MNRAFVGFIHGGESEDRPTSGDETVVYSDDETSTGETESLYQLQEGRLGGCSDGDSIPDPCVPPNRVAIFWLFRMFWYNSWLIRFSGFRTLGRLCRLRFLVGLLLDR